MAGQEDQIVILISNRRLQLAPITRELGNLGLEFEPPGGEAIRDQDVMRAVYSILRIAKDCIQNSPDYVAYRSLLAQLHGVGTGTAKAIGDKCVENHQNYRALFHMPALPHWLTNRLLSAVGRGRVIVQSVAAWTLHDTIGNRNTELEQLLSNVIFVGASQTANLIQEWNALFGTLPPDMNLEELLLFLATDDENGQRQVLDAVLARLGQAASSAAVAQKKIRILTMHGAKGLSGKVVFIPSAEQGIMPSLRAIHAVGLLNEQRRLFYVSMTRAKAACIVTHAGSHTGPEAFQIMQQPQVMLPRSQFLNEAGVTSVNRNTGLTTSEVAQIIADVNNL